MRVTTDNFQHRVGDGRINCDRLTLSQDDPRRRCGRLPGQGVVQGNAALNRLRREFLRELGQSVREFAQGVGGEHSVLSNRRTYRIRRPSDILIGARALIADALSNQALIAFRLGFNDFRF